MTVQSILADTNAKMNKAVDVAKEDFAAIRTGRAHPSMFAKIMVDYYGTTMPLSQLATVQVPEARMALITPFDKGATASIEKAIRESDLGVNPGGDGNVIRVNFPQLTEERRKELTKVVKAEGEDTKIAIRNLRRDANEHLKRLTKDKEISEDEERRAQDEIQKLTDKFVADVDKLIVEKEKEIMTV
ncbi:MAG: ribosome recycling factor [Actinobacteria bacterium]|nr:ribosome recycling factor [Actinomycetota bacterium]